MFCVLYHVLPFLFCSFWACYEVYQARKTLTKIEKEIQRLNELSKDIVNLQDRFIGLEDVTIKALDQHIDDVHIELNLLQKKFSSFSQKEVNNGNV